MDLTPVQRSRDGAVVAGVCAGLARRWQVDPLILRIAVVLLSLFAGLGVAVYLGAVLLVPKEGTTDFPIRTLLPFTRTWPAPAVIGAVVGAGILLVSYLGGSTGIGPAIGLGFLWYFGFYRNRRATDRPDVTGQPPTPVPPTWESPALPPSSGWQPSAPGTDFRQAAAAWQERVAQHRHQVAAHDQRAAHDGLVSRDQVPPLQFFGAPTPAAPADLPVPATPAPVVAAPRPQRRGARWIWPATLCLTGTVLAVLAALGASPLAFWAAALACVGLALVVSTWFGRPRGLLPVGVALLLATGIAMMPADGLSAARMGDQTWTYTSQADLPDSRRMDMGSLTIDLRAVAVTRDAEVTFGQQAGETRLLLPSAGNVTVDVTVEAGSFQLPDSSDDGLGLKGHYARVDDPAKPTLHIHVAQKLGEVVVQP